MILYERLSNFYTRSSRLYVCRKTFFVYLLYTCRRGKCRRPAHPKFCATLYCAYETFAKGLLSRYAYISEQKPRGTLTPAIGHASHKSFSAGILRLSHAIIYRTQYTNIHIVSLFSEGRNSKSGIRTGDEQIRFNYLEKFAWDLEHSSNYCFTCS